jgi:HEAT repeat protein
MGPAEYLRANSSVLEQLASYEERERREGIASFRRLGAERGAAVCLYLLNDPAFEDARVEVILAWLLAEWRDGRAVPHLLGFVRNPDRGVVAMAVDGLKSFGGNLAVRDALLEMLRSSVVSERRTAAQLLMYPGWRDDDLVALVAQRYRDEPDPDVRALFLLGIRDSRHPRRSEFIINALTDPDPDLRTTAWQTLRKYKDLPQVEFDSGAEPEVRAQAIAQLREWDKRRVRGGGRS